MPTPPQTAAPDPAPAQGKAEGFWQRRLVRPALVLLKQGVTPRKIASTIAVGTVCSLFPILGTTTTLNISIGLWLRMNQPLLLAINYLLTPVHLMMIIVYLRLGEWLWRAHDNPLDLQAMQHAFHELTLREFGARFGWALIHATSAWLVTAPILFFLIYLPARRILVREEPIVRA